MSTLVSSLKKSTPEPAKDFVRSVRSLVRPVLGRSSYVFDGATRKREMIPPCIGGHLIKQLLRDGVNVIRSVDGKPPNEWYQVHPGVENVTADLKQLDACHRAVEGADIIFNLAADQLVDIAESFAGIKLKRTYNLNAPRGVNGRNSDNTLIQARLGWEPSTQLKDGLHKTYDWIESQVEALSCV